MPAQTRFNILTKNVADGVHNFASHTFKAALTNTAPNSATAAVLADITQITAANGYPSGGPTVPMSTSTASGVVKVTATDVTITATGGFIGPFRYVVFYNDTPTSPAKPLISWVDAGSAITLAAGETFTIDFDGTAGFMTI